MSDIAINADRVFDLTGMICDGSASASELAEMDAYLRADQQSCDRYMGYCWMHVALTMELQLQRAVQSVHQQINIGLAVPDTSTFDAVKIEPSSSFAPTFLSTAYHRTIDFFSQELPFSLLIGAVVTSLGLWAASMVYVSGPEKIAQDSSSLPSRSTYNPAQEVVGRITGMVGCKWPKGEGSPLGDDNVSLGRKFTLDSGLMEITYNTGAKVILQGPVTYEVESNGGYMAAGKLTGKLEKKVASGQWPVASDINKSEISNPQSLIPNPFVIRTPTATVTDLGTEFGVEVTKEGDSVIQVKTGAVDVVAKEGADHVCLQADGSRNAARIEAGTRKIITLCSNSEQFVYVLPKPSLRGGAVVEWSGMRPQGSLSPAKDDLLQTSLAKVINDDPEPPRYELSATPSRLYDGTLYGPKNEDLNIDSNKFSYTPRDSRSLTFVLDTTRNREGYTIDAIDLFTGYFWMRVGQKYKVEFSQVGHDNWLPVVSYDHSALQDKEFWEARSRIQNRIAGEPLATHVNRIRFTFYDTVELIKLNQRPGCVYREIDVIGSPTVSDARLETTPAHPQGETTNTNDGVQSMMPARKQ